MAYVKRILFSVLLTVWFILSVYWIWLLILAAPLLGIVSSPLLLILYVLYERGSQYTSSSRRITVSSQSERDDVPVHYGQQADAYRYRPTMSNGTQYKTRKNNGERNRTSSVLQNSKNTQQQKMLE